MGFKNKNEEEVAGFHFPIWNDTQLEDIDHRLRIKFFHKKKLESGEEVDLFDETAYLKKVQALTPSGAIRVVITGDDDGKPTYCFPTQYAKAQDMLRQWRSFVGRKERVEQRRIEGLEKISEGMQIQEEVRVF